MGFEAVHEAMEQSLAQEGAAPATPEAPKENEVNAAPQSQEPTQAEIQEAIELDKLEKVKWEGKEWTLKDLKAATLRQEDYTKKTQSLAQERKKFDEERTSFSESKKYYDNLDADLNSVLQDPALASKFKEIYPVQFHGILDRFLANNSASPQGQQTPVVPKYQTDPYIVNKLKEIDELKGKLTAREQQEFESETQAKLTLLDSAEQKYAEKYKFADPETVISKAQYLMSKGHFGDPKDPSYTDNFMKTLETLYKQSNDAHLKKYEAHYKKQIDEQKLANGKARDIASGGGIPGKAPERIPLKDVKNRMLSDLER